MAFTWQLYLVSICIMENSPIRVSCTVLYVKGIHIQIYVKFSYGQCYINPTTSCYSIDPDQCFKTDQFKRISKHFWSQLLVSEGDKHNPSLLHKNNYNTIKQLETGTWNICLIISHVSQLPATLHIEHNLDRCCYDSVGLGSRIEGSIIQTKNGTIHTYYTHNINISSQLASYLLIWVM